MENEPLQVSDPDHPGHHDGRHHILFRYVESIEKYEHLGERLANGNLNEEQFRKATKSIRKFVAKVYGW